MVLLKLLNLLAPIYFVCLLSITFSIQVFLLLPGMCKESLFTFSFSSLLHNSLFMIFVVNVLGNYILVIWKSPHGREFYAEAELPGKTFCHLCARVMGEQEHHCFFTGTCIGQSNLRSFVLFCLHCSCSCFHAMVIGVGYISESITLSFCDPTTFLRLLPISVTRFFSGSLLNSDMLVVLMIYVWFGVGLACAAFCCHQLLLISRGCSIPRFHPSDMSVTSWKNNLQNVFGKRWLMAIFVPNAKKQMN
ncbi:hypothetical protein GDO86_015877 [Hymenochirus boettgeri]|uniref:Palmitoyltransferase n=1 Tax=Hymenochirus boettgeri TaxID=247094 RepID=A0A8T2JX80_9PIPI|nr:hypothetical protein GDO86_015877 [Hymenochirus boettgeri]